MNDYAYQIIGALENAKGQFTGLRVLVCTDSLFETLDVPVEILDKNTRDYIQFRLKLTHGLAIQKLPETIQHGIRAPLGRWLDFWVLENFYGNTSKPKNINS